jgi:hypothetical protein
VDSVWVIIRSFVSLPGSRLLATIAGLWVIGLTISSAAAAALPDSTWVALPSLPNQPKAALFALAVDPSNSQVVIAGDAQGSLVRTTSGGSAWTTAFNGKSAILTISFSPNTPRLVFAGTRGGGGLVSRDDGATWSVARGLEGRSVRVFAFALTFVAAGTDRGVYTSSTGSVWAPSGLSGVSVGALAVEAIHDPVRLVAGSDVQPPSGGLALYQSVDGGLSWQTLRPPISGTITVRLAAGPLPPTGNVRPLLAGTNSGLFTSRDNGTTFSPLSGGGLLPTTDYTQAAFITTHFDRFYVASDGGGSGAGGLWRTNNAGQTFTSLRPPELSITALAVSNEEKPVLYLATFRPSTHVATIWAYHDTGGTPQGPSATPSVSASGVRATPPTQISLVEELTRSGQLPYIALGLGALAVILTAVAAHLRGRYR